MLNEAQSAALQSLERRVLAGTAAGEAARLAGLSFAQAPEAELHVATAVAREVAYSLPGRPRVLEFGRAFRGGSRQGMIPLVSLRRVPALLALVAAVHALLGWPAPSPERLCLSYSRYETGDSGVRHRDCSPLFGEHVASLVLSSASPACFALHPPRMERLSRHEAWKDCARAIDNQGFVIALTGPSRYDWQHSVSPARSGSRDSLSWRFVDPSQFKVESGSSSPRSSDRSLLKAGLTSLEVPTFENPPAQQRRCRFSSGWLTLQQILLLQELRRPLRRAKTRV